MNALQSILRAVLVVPLVLWFLSPDADGADTDLRSELRTVARSVAKLLKSEGKDSIAIGQFTGPPNFPTSAGAGIVQILTEEFAAEGITVKTRANYGLKGEFTAVKVKEQKQNNRFQTFDTVAVRIRGSIVDEFGEVITDFNLDSEVADGRETETEIDKGKFAKDIQGEENFVHLVGTTVKLPPTDVNQEDRANRLLESYQRPEDPSNLRIDGTRLFGGAGSPYGVEILAGPKPKSKSEPEVYPSTIELKEGLPHVGLNRGEVYQLRLINNSPHEAAVKVTIDGVGVFEFSELREDSGPRAGRPKYSVYIIKPHSSMVLKGWHRNNEVSDSFLVTSYEHSAAAKLGHKSGLGTITATFSAAWPINEPPPPDEPGLKKSGPNATGFGPPVRQVVKEVKRRIGVMRAAVTVRYSKP